MQHKAAKGQQANSVKVKGVAKQKSSFSQGAHRICGIIKAAKEQPAINSKAKLVAKQKSSFF